MASELEGWPTFTRPTLAVLSDGQTWQTAKLFDAVADEMNLTPSQRAETLNSGQARARNRMGWALSHLTRAGAVTKVRNGNSVITDTGRQLLAEHPVNISWASLSALPQYHNYSPKRRKRPPSAAPAEDTRYWFVGAFYGSDGDQTAEFVQQGIWRNGYTDKYADDVNSMQPGERIAIKAAYVRKHDLPFDNKGNPVSVMGIKAVGAIIRNHGDGRTVDVDWEDTPEIREWYFYTSRDTVWKVVAGSWRADGLIKFAFEGEDQDIDQFRNAPYWRGRFGDDATAEPKPPNETDPDDAAQIVEVDSYSLSDITTDGCFVPENTLAEYLNALRAKKNLILQGPPGTGKTWLAKRLGYSLIGEKNRDYLRAIQFHPSTSYEDFVRGWRPSAEGKLVLSDGIFLEMVEAAQADPGHNYVLVIEEINRGNLAQIFGELLTLLESEKRLPSEAIDLSYRHPDDVALYIPENLYLIGTMNLADRSLAIVDFALRRRFAFAELRPHFNQAWRDWVHRHNTIPVAELESVAHRINLVNESIAADPSLGVQYQIGHSFFTPAPTRKIGDTEQWIRQVVEHELRALLAEYWFDDPDRIDRETSRLLGEIP